MSKKKIEAILVTLKQAHKDLEIVEVPSDLEENIVDGCTDLDTLIGCLQQIVDDYDEAEAASKEDPETGDDEDE